MTEENRKLSRENELKELKRKADITRRNRINAANRLLRQERCIQNINIYYSCVSAIITVLGLCYPEESYSIASAILTVVLAISIVYLNAQKYGERAQQMQINYLALQQLIFRVDNCIAQSTEEELKMLQNEYIELLQTSENHIEQDHRETMYYLDRKDEQERTGTGIKRLRGWDTIYLWSWRIVLFFLKTLLWTVPALYLVYTFIESTRV